MKTKVIAVAFVASMVLAACSTPQAAAPTSAPAATPAPAATEAPAATAVPAATDAPAATAAMTATEAMSATGAMSSTEAMSATTATTATTASAPAAAAAAFKIDSTKSEAKFTLHETLMGNPTTVVGTTPKVDGTIDIDWATPANTKIGTIQIDASDLKTDQDKRNGAIRNFILQTSQFQFIKFEPTAIEGLPAAAKAGDALTFKVTGNLTIRNITKPATFDVTAKADSDSQVSGSAKTNITRAAFELTIPSVPMVADVTDDVALEFNFVATK